VTISTKALKRSDLPTGDIGWREFSTFALSFDPRIDPPIEEDMAQMGELDPKEAHTIRALRARLYNWQRIWHHHNYERPPPEFYADVRQVIGWIEKTLKADSGE
jgi:hypothetical protein